MPGASDGFINPGDLRLRVTVKRRDDRGDFRNTSKAKVVAELWASIQPIRGKLLESAKQLHELVDYRMVTRFNENLKAGDEVFRNGTDYVYEIKHTQPVGQDRRWTEAFLVERV